MPTMSELDQAQIIKSVYDATNQALQVNVVASASGAASAVKITDGSGSGDDVTVTPSKALKVDGSAVTQPVSFSGNVTVVQPTGTNLHTVVDSSALPTGAASSANQISAASANASFASKSASALINNPFDYIALTYVVSGNGIGQVQTASYKLGGASGTLVNTLTLAYDASNNLSSVTKS